MLCRDVTARGGAARGWQRRMMEVVQMTKAVNWRAHGGRVVRSALWAGALIAAALATAQAQQVQRIAAIVNDQVISAYDLQQRVKLVLVTSGIPNTPENVERIEKQILRSLVDEKLQLLEAAKHDVKVTVGEIDSEIERLAKQSNVSAGQILKSLEDQGVSTDTLRDQIKAEIAWAKLVQGRYGSRVNVSEEEIDQVIERMQANADKPQYRVSEIFLPVDSPDQAEAVHQNALRLLEQIREGAPFPQIARAFSQAPSASRGGDIGWVQDGQLPPDLNQVVSKLKPGRISMPVPTTSGFYILAMSDRRLSPMGTPTDAELSLFEVVLEPLPKENKEQQQETLRMAYGLSQAVPGCAAARQIAAENDRLEGRELGTMKLSEISNKVMKDQLTTLTEGDATDPARTQSGGYVVFFVCGRKAIGDTAIPREAVESQLFNQQLSMLARRYLRDLRRDSTVEMR
jgi:peptidyl-prolyl cis-trans isomerase SurA